MDITIIGIVVMILSVYAFVKNEKMLLYLVVFFSTFTAASMINIEKTVTGISPIYFIGGLWIIKIIIKYIRDKISLKEFFSKIKDNKLTLALIIFLIVILLSEINILIFSGKITYTNLNSGVNNIINFSKSNITQPIYVGFMIVLSIFMSIEIKEKAEIINLVKVFTYSTIFALVWGILQFCMFYLKIDYPAYLFNNNIALGQMYNQMIYGLKRVNSIALEPSTFSLNILQFMPIPLILWLSNYKIYNSKIKSNLILILTLVLSLLCGLLTTSTTSYVGMVILILMVTVYILFFSVKDKELHKNKRRVFYLYIFGAISILIALFMTLKIFRMDPQTIIDAFKDITVNKKNLETGHHRLNAIKMSLEIFKQSPILGSGWGSFRSFDLTSNLLSNLGILGGGSFAYILIIVLKKCIDNIKRFELEGLIVIMVILMPTIALGLSIPDLVFGYYWIAIVCAYNYFESKDEVR